MTHPYRPLYAGFEKPPPRTVSTGLRWQLRVGRGVAATVLCIMAVCSSVVLWLALAWTDVGAVWKFRGAKHATGRVTRVVDTNSEINERRVYRIEYEFRDGRDRAVSGKSYTSDAPMSAGQRVSVEYVRGEPSVSRIRGMRRKPLPWWLGGAILMFPMFTIVWFVKGWREGNRHIGLLREGLLTHGKLIQVGEPEDDDDPTRRHTFEYEIRSGRLCNVTISAVPGTLDDDNEEPLVYHPDRPTDATTLDNLPGEPRIDDDDVLHSSSAAFVVTGFVIVGAVNLIGALIVVLG